MKAVLALIPLVLVGCDHPQTALPQSVPSYQIVPASDGSAWELNTDTGEMRYCTEWSPKMGSPACFIAISPPPAGFKTEDPLGIRK